MEGTDTGFDGEEGTFTICSFWLVTALAMIGETDRAHALCQKLLGFAGPLQLYAEEIDVTTGQHLGNFPQAFTHLALIEAVSLLIESEQKASSLSFAWRRPAVPAAYGPADRGSPIGKDSTTEGPAAPLRYPNVHALP